MGKKLRIGALISGGGTNLQAIIDACESGKIDGEIVFTGADTTTAKGLDRAKKHGIPGFVVDYGQIIRNYRAEPGRIELPRDFDPDEIRTKQRLFSASQDPETVRNFLTTRALAEARLLQEIQPFKTDLLVLAGFMRTLTPYFIDRYNGKTGHQRIMNIHPALLPAFPGIDGYGDTFRYGCKVAGCTVHFVDYGEDSGPIIGQRSFPISEEDTLEEVKQKGLKLEWELYPQCIQWYAENRIRTVTMTYPQEKTGIPQRTIVKIAGPA